MTVCHNSATCSWTRPPGGGGPEKPKPGREGSTTLNASRGSPPCAAGSVSSGSSARYSRNELGQPCVSTSGSGSGPVPGACTRCTVTPSISARRWVSRSRRAWRISGSKARQSAISSASQAPGTPRSQVLPVPGASRAVPSRKARSPRVSISSAARNGSARGCGEAIPRSWRTGRVYGPQLLCPRERIGAGTEGYAPLARVKFKQCGRGAVSVSLTWVEAFMGRDIQPIKISGEDRGHYRDKLQRSLEVFARMLREHLFDADTSHVGLEIELNLVDDDGAPSMRNANVLDAIADPAWATELGQFNLEINIPPRQLGGGAVADQEQEIRASLNAADAKARSTGSRLVMVGILPTLAEQDMTEGTLSANERYKVLNEQIFAARGENMRIEIDGAEQLITDADSITPEAACTSVQLHLQVSPEAFAHYWNAAQAIAGVQVALAANSPFLFGRQLWHETRITLFEQATDTRPDELKHQGVRPRVWFGERWITSVFDLFEENIRYFPALLPICEAEDPQE